MEQMQWAKNAAVQVEPLPIMVLIIPIFIMHQSDKVSNLLVLR